MGWDEMGRSGEVGGEGRREGGGDGTGEDRRAGLLDLRSLKHIVRRHFNMEGGGNTIAH